MKKLAKRYSKHNSVEAYSCMCWMSLASCACNCYGCACSDKVILNSTYNGNISTSTNNEQAYTSHLQANQNNKP